MRRQAITSIYTCALTLAATVAAPALAQNDAAAGPAHGGELPSVVVTASGFEQETSQAPASISVITQQDLQEKRFSSIAEALNDVEGVDVGASAGKTGGLNVSIRGMPSEYTLILIDGRRQNPAGSVTPNGFGETSTSFIPPLSAIERIEVIRGPMSTLYGSDAMGGVINIITRKVADSWTGAVNLGTTVQEHNKFGNSSTADVYLNGPLIQDKLGLAIRGSTFQRSESDITFRQDDGSVARPNRGSNPVEADNYSLGGKLTFTPSRDHEFWLDGDISRQRYNNDDSQLGTLDDPNGRIAGYADELRFEREQIAIGHDGRIGIGRLSTSLMHNTTETIGRTIPGSENGGDFGQPYPDFPDLIIGSPRKLETTNLVLDTKYVMPLGDSHVTTLGGQWWDAELEDGLATEKFEQTMWSLFAEDEWMLSDTLALTTGVRYDHHDAFGSQVSPRAYLVWNPSDTLTVKGGVSRGYKTPSLNDLHDGINGITGQGRTLTIGNPDLEPEVSTNTEIGIQYDNQRGFMIGATVFYNEFDDKIAAGDDIDIIGHPTIPDGTYSQKVNVDKAVTQGVELNTRIRLAEDWLLSANYTYTDSEQKSGNNKGDPLTDTPEHMVNAKLRWFATERLSTWLQGEYRSERYRSDAAARAQLGDYKDYSLLHLGASYEASDNVTLHAAVYNVLDEDFIDYRPYIDSRGRLAYSNTYNNNIEGRRFWLSANVRF